MKISRPSPRYESELLELADDTYKAANLTPEIVLRKELVRIADALRFMVTDNERFMSGEER